MIEQGKNESEEDYNAQKLWKLSVKLIANYIKHCVPAIARLQSVAITRPFF